MQALYTIGYEGSSPVPFIEALQSHGVALLADVRAIAFSRKPGFSKQALQEHLEKAGLSYLHLKPLGNPVKLGKESAGDYPASYLRHLQSDEARAALETLKVTAQHTPTCIMCFERDPNSCHRLYTAAALKDFFKSVHIIIENGPQKAFCF